MVKDATRAAEIISRIRLLFKKGTAELELVNLNEMIREMIVLLRSEITRYSISVRTELASDLPQVMGDRVQLQQVLMNLMINSIDAMKDVNGARELGIKSQPAESEHLMVSVSDTGVGLPRQHADQIFNAFFTTKPHGTGMGLRISRSIVESHGELPPAARAHQFPVPTLAPNPQLQRFRRLIDFVSVDPIPRPPQYFAPIGFSHPPECNQSSQKPLLSRICGLIPVPEVVPACDKGPFP
jgi:histidine kinase/DNA gyrase B/HSP90-like ATPase